MATAMRETAKKNLEKMVKGAAREVSSPAKASEKRAGAEAAQPEKAGAGGISKQALQQLRSLIEKNGKTLQKVPIESIQLHENIRDGYDETGLRHLADSLDKEGLIQFPTLALKDQNSDGTFVCKNGHRRILAAKMLGWKSIECVILPFSSARDELYHTIAANIREDVFYLDLAAAYQQAARLGESDQAIAERSGVNPRTVGWYRRLTRMSNECQALCRQHPEVFTATWAIKEARKGELPPPAQLLKQMQLMLARHQSLVKPEGENRESPKPSLDKEKQKASRDQLKAVFSGSRGTSEAQFAWNLVDQLCSAGYLNPKIQEKLRKQFLPGAQKASRKAQ